MFENLVDNVAQLLEHSISLENSSIVRESTRNYSIRRQELMEKNKFKRLGYTHNIH